MKEPIELNIISHQHNSHTFYPKIVGNPVEQFEGFSDCLMVDFPGMFDSKGPIMDIAMLLGLQRILRKAKKAKVLIMVSAGVLEPSATKLITEIKNMLNCMFKNPEKNVIVALTKANMYPNLFDEDEVVDIALGNNGE